jgi:hypothetical protein
VKRENGSGGALLLLARGGPSPGKELVQAIVRPKVDEADENVGEIGLGLYAVQFVGLDQRGEDGPIFGAAIVTREESILARKSNLALILPISGRMSSCTIAGIRCMGGACVVFSPSAAQTRVTLRRLMRRLRQSLTSEPGHKNPIPVAKIIDYGNEDRDGRNCQAGRKLHDICDKPSHSCGKAERQRSNQQKSPEEVAMVRLNSEGKENMPEVRYPRGCGHTEEGGEYGRNLENFVCEAGHRDIN